MPDTTELLFAAYASKTLEPTQTIGAKWERMLDAMDLQKVVRGKRTCVKMHLGGGYGFTTIHPYFTRKLVAKIRASGASDVFLCDTPGAVRSAVERGYTEETMGCPILSVAGPADNQYRMRPVNPAFGEFKEIEIGSTVLEAGALIDFSHVKGHGACGFGGASKNLSMGCVTQAARGKIHHLEGGLEWSEERCTHCGKCVDNCPNGAMEFDEKGKLDIFYHNCKYCNHCGLICPAKAIKLVGGGYRSFQRGMALTTKTVLDPFTPAHCYFINFLMNITLFCDCWGMTTPNLVPDIGILAGPDIVAIETASLDLVKTENLIPGSLPPKWPELGETGHLFERLHAKDPFAVVDYLEELGLGNRAYCLREIE